MLIQGICLICSESTTSESIGTINHLSGDSTRENRGPSGFFRVIINLALSSALLTTLTIGTAIASPDDTSGGFPTLSPLKRLVVLDFELAGDLGGSNFEAAHIQRTRMASAKLCYALRHSHLYNVVDNTPATTLIEELGSQQHLYQCNGCEFDIAKHLNAEVVLVPWVFRRSNLVLTMHVEYSGCRHRPNNHEKSAGLPRR